MCIRYGAVIGQFKFKFTHACLDSTVHQYGPAAAYDIASGRRHKNQTIYTCIHVHVGYCPHML
jgi:hypothetical protein